ncbi:hypothetical protein QQX09_08605 [Demequina sp. SYSU T00192]|uniref:Uncharacterized protein n=1 Tax=Demequina litoralis TaxID=3051660 RepID=A0ABT8G9U8_9MICO|nr:hypothetical protein [Demequina sp. SYSU T00192]MDN4475915.1 hypothetical protein [Demequina sp. SYSU T00192]
MVEQSIAPPAGADRGARAGAAATDLPTEGREPRTTAPTTMRRAA